MSDTAVPLFPLPNVLLYPGAVLPLHVFEPRYVELVEDMQAQQQDRMALALLQPGWKDRYFDQPPYFAIGGLGRLLSTQPAQDGRYNILLEGLGRAQLTEVASDRKYRKVEATLLKETTVSQEDEGLRAELLDALSVWSEEQVQLDPSRGVSYLADVLLLTLGVPIEEKQRIFEMLDPAARARTVLQHFRNAQAQMKRIGQADPSGDSAAWN